MSFSKKERNPTRKIFAISLVVLMHIVIVYALVNGLARKIVEVVRGPIETKIIEELKKLPPPDKPTPPPPKEAEPPPFVPPVEVVIAPVAAPTNAITTQTEIPEPKPEPKPEPPHVPVHSAPVVDAAHACRQPTYPAASLREEEQGVVALSFLIDVNGRVIESKVDRSSGYARLDVAAKSALSLCQFKPGTVDGKAEPSWAKLEYVWRLE